jgi:hypothetical protein
MISRCSPCLIIAEPAWLQFEYAWCAWPRLLTLEASNGWFSKRPDVFWVEPALCDLRGNENIDIAVGQTLEGFTAALVNHNSNKLAVSLKPTKSASPGGQWVDLVTGNKIPSAAPDNSVKLTINGSAVRVVEFRRSAAN